MNKEFVFIEHPHLEERVLITRTALQRYMKEGWKVAKQQFGHAKPKATRKPRDVAAPEST